MNSRLYILTSILITALLGFLILLIFWGNKTIELREELFVDQANIAVNEMIVDLESDYYCFSLMSDADLPKLPSFYLLDPSKSDYSDTLSLSYTTSDGELRAFKAMPIMGPARLRMSLIFDFNDIPDFIENENLSPFELGIRDYYNKFIYDEKGNRLIDTLQVDSLLHLCIGKLYPEAELNYAIYLKESNQLIYAKEPTSLDQMNKADVEASIFTSDDRIPDLLLQVEVTNKGDMFANLLWSNYLSAIVLTLVSILLIVLLIRMQLHQKRMLHIQKDFIHGMTHEFNTPLSNIKLLAQKLLKSTDSDVKKSGLILNEEGDKLQVGINLILTTALIEKDELLLNKEQIDLNYLLEKTLNKNKDFLNDSGIALNVHLTKENLMAQGDSFHLENVFQNMINNVRKHSEATNLSVETIRNNGHCIVQFSDNGKGILDEYKSRIFEKFESRHNNGRKNGYGLGLYYSKMILEMHGGKIELMEQIEKGSSFSIQLPA